MPSSLSVVEEAPARAGRATIAPTINDLAIRVGTVNGSGSQSANLVILRSLYAMGIPCSGKNVFPSNIEGLPTWFHIRASAKGYICHVLDPQTVLTDLGRVGGSDRAAGHADLERRAGGDDPGGDCLPGDRGIAVAIPAS